MEFGLVADGHALPDLDVLDRYLSDALEALVAAVEVEKKPATNGSQK